MRPFASTISFARSEHYVAARPSPLRSQSPPSVCRYSSRVTGAMPRPRVGAHTRHVTQRRCLSDSLYARYAPAKRSVLSAQQRRLLYAATRTICFIRASLSSTRTPVFAYEDARFFRDIDIVLWNAENPPEYHRREKSAMRALMLEDPPSMSRVYALARHHTRDS